jgi:hypothetical protein
MMIFVIAAVLFVLVLLNAIFLGVIFFMRRKMAAVNEWPTTMGTVMSSTIERRHSSEGGWVDYPAVQYSYQVSGQPYQGTKIAPGMDVGGTGAGKVVSRYAPGAQVMVFYNPQNPSDAVLERKAPAQWIMWLLLVIFDCALCGVVPLIWFTMGR